jgi:large conductance mechanosensitive channel
LLIKSICASVVAFEITINLGQTKIDTMKNMITEFKAFIFKGSVLELAIAFILATTFKPIVDMVVKGIVMPIIARIIGEPSFDALVIDLGKGAFITYGALITLIVNFILIGLVLFFIMKAYEKSKKKEEEAPATPAGPTKEELLTEIRDLLKNK